MGDSIPLKQDGDSVPLKQDGRFRIINACLLLIEIESKEIKVRVSELEKRQRVTSDEILNNDVIFVLKIKVECFSLWTHVSPQNLADNIYARSCFLYFLSCQVI